MDLLNTAGHRSKKCFVQRSYVKGRVTVSMKGDCTADTSTCLDKQKLSSDFRPNSVGTFWEYSIVRVRKFFAGLQLLEWANIQETARNITMFFEKDMEVPKMCPSCKGSGFLQSHKRILNDLCWFCEGIGALPITGVKGSVPSRSMAFEPCEIFKPNCAEFWKENCLSTENIKPAIKVSQVPEKLTLSKNLVAGSGSNDSGLYLTSEKHKHLRKMPRHIQKKVQREALERAKMIMRDLNQQSSTHSVEQVLVPGVLGVICKSLIREGGSLPIIGFSLIAYGFHRAFMFPP